MGALLLPLGFGGRGVWHGGGNRVYHATREGLTSILSMAVSLPQRLAGAFLEMGVGRKWARTAMPQNLPKIRNPIAESPVFRGTTSLLPKTSAPEKRMWPDFKAHIRMTLQSYSRCCRILFLFGFIFKL